MGMGPIATSCGWTHRRYWSVQVGKMLKLHMWSLLLDRSIRSRICPTTELALGPTHKCHRFPVWTYLAPCRMRPILLIWHKYFHCNPVVISLTEDYRPDSLVCSSCFVPLRWCKTVLSGQASSDQLLAVLHPWSYTKQPECTGESRFVMSSGEQAIDETAHVTSLSCLHKEQRFQERTILVAHAFTRHLGGRKGETLLDTSSSSMAAASSERRPLGPAASTSKHIPFPNICPD